MQAQQAIFKGEKVFLIPLRHNSRVHHYHHYESKIAFMKCNIPQLRNAAIAFDPAVIFLFVKLKISTLSNIYKDKICVNLLLEVDFFLAIVYSINREN